MDCDGRSRYLSPVTGEEVLSHTDASEIAAREEIALLQQAIRVNTVNPPGAELALARLIEERLKQAGIASDVRLHGADRANLVACLDSGSPGPDIMLSGHLDTVPLGESPWTFEPFSATLQDGRIYGRGSADMKGGLMALLCAFLRHGERPRDAWCGRVWFVATLAEETGSEGARLLVEEGLLPRFDAILVAEPTDNRVVVAHKGVLWVRVNSYGRTGHASMPASGINAIDHMQRFCSHLKHFELPSRPNRFLREPTLSVTTIQGGRQTNVIPDHCAITIDIRTRPDQDHGEIVERLREIAARVVAEEPSASFTVEAMLDLGAIQTDPEAPFVAMAQAAAGRFAEDGGTLRGAEYFTDASAFVQLGDNIVILGPGSPMQAHQTDEYLEVEAYFNAIEIYSNILDSMTKKMEKEQGGSMRKEISMKQ